jgi:predicted nucleotidyltransferase
MGALSVGSYRLAARAASSVLGRRPGVRAVYLRRGAAVGEVAFARSDIDLTIVIDADAELVSLSAVVSRLRRVVQVLGECLVFEPEDLDRWHQTDPYRASQDRRTAISLHGPPPRILRRRIAPEQAARRCAFLLEHYLPIAVRRGDRRNLLKFALDMWTAHGVATGALEEPYLTRRQAADAYRVPRNVDGLLASCLAAAESTHAALLPPLPPAATPAPFRVSLPPTYEPRTFVLLSRPNAPLPRAAAAPNAFIATIAALDLYVHCVNPFAACALPRELGLGEPPAAAFERACRFYGAPHRLREPGFVGGNWQAALARLDTVAHTVRQLQAGASPRSLGMPELPKVKSIRDYYARVYPTARDRAMAIWESLDRLPERTEGSSVRFVTPRAGS